MHDSGVERVRRAMSRINESWLAKRVEDLGPLLDEHIVMILPGFAGRVQGRDTLLAGFRDFCDNAQVHEYTEDDTQIDVAGGTGVVTFRYQMVYERGGRKYRATGRDLWVFARRATEWIAVWRAMLEASETDA